jgi:RNA-directed DNA polymerase
MTSTGATNKPFWIEKRQVYEAFKAVKSNRGAAGVDGQTLEMFEEDLAGNLYKLWNRMSSGTYFPPLVRAVSIPKRTGGERILGVPTVGDRIAQMVVKQMIEPDLEPIFLRDSYGYRPRKSALDAIGVTRQRCWKYDWVLEFDIKGLFDNLPHDLLLKAVRKHVKCNWALLYIERWLTAAMERDGEIIERTRGTPQGGVISPILSNLFLHYAFDLWLSRTHPDLPWCRYADDGLVQPDRAGSGSPQGRTSGAAGSVRASDASDEDQDRILQRQSAQGGLSECHVRLPRISIQAATGGELTADRVLLWVHPSGQSRSAQVHSGNDQELEHSPADAGDAD